MRCYESACVCAGGSAGGRDRSSEQDSKYTLNCTIKPGWRVGKPKPRLEKSLPSSLGRLSGRVSFRLSSQVTSRGQAHFDSPRQAQVTSFDSPRRAQVTSPGQARFNSPHLDSSSDSRRNVLVWAEVLRESRDELVVLALSRVCVCSCVHIFVQCLFVYACAEQLCDVCALV